MMGWITLNCTNFLSFPTQAIMNETISTNVPPAVPYDVIPAKHSARTLVACFDGTGDSFDGDVRALFYPVSLVYTHPCRTRTSYSFSLRYRKTTGVTRWSITRSCLKYVTIESELISIISSLALEHTPSRRSSHRWRQTSPKLWT